MFRQLGSSTACLDCKQDIHLRHIDVYQPRPFDNDVPGRKASSTIYFQPLLYSACRSSHTTGVLPALQHHHYDSLSISYEYTTVIYRFTPPLSLFFQTEVMPCALPPACPPQSLFFTDRMRLFSRQSLVSCGRCII